MKLPPRGVWLGVVIALGLGLIALLTAPYWKVEKYPNLHLEELGRDVGIAFIVAAVVSLIYEWNTRSIAEKENTLNLYNSLMSANVPEEVWEEVHKEIFHWPVRRSNVKIKLKVTRDFPLPDGRKKTFSPRTSVLWMEYEYDLYRLTAGKKKYDVTHVLDYFFEKDEDITVPRFEHVKITGCDSKVIKEYSGENLEDICNPVDGSLELTGDNGIPLPSLKKKQYVRVTIERYEFVNTPGVYAIVMPELVIGKIKISIEELPEDLEAEVITMAYHDFPREEGKNVWNFDGVMLPGQGLGIGFKKKGTIAARAAEATAPTGGLQSGTGGKDASSELGQGSTETPSEMPVLGGSQPS